jgi:adenine-specific DNA-methyltransferase
LENFDPETNGESKDIVADNITQLKQLFPEVFTEDKLDFTALQATLGEYVETSDERYNFTWHGKATAKRIAQTPSTGTLRPCKEESKDWDTTQNLFIEGDNLEVLKLLQKAYHKQVKMIYIDPPYNTGKEFIYPDNYQDNLDTYLEYTGQKDSEGRRFGTNAETSGRYHTNWLSMIYPRLKLARNLLRDDGVIFISISDHEFSNLRKICDEIYGEENFIGCIVWNSTKSVTNTAIISVGHTYNLVYAKSGEYFKNNRSTFRLPEDGEGFDNPDNDPRGPWKADPYQVGGWRPNQQYEIVNPSTGVKYKPNEGCSWKNDYQKFKQLQSENRIVFGVTGEGGPQRKRFLSEAENRGKVTKTWWDDVGTTTNATQSLKNLFDGKSVFSNPKPIELIQRMIELGDFTKNEIVLDFFAGSASTAHAVIQGNLENSSSRKFILVQIPEHLDEAKKDLKAAIDFCDDNNLPRNIAEISKERLRRVAEKVKKDSPDYQGDLGFKVFKLASSNIKPWDADFEQLEADLYSSVDNIKEDRSSDDVLYELLLKYGIDLTIPIENHTVAGKTVYSVGLGALLICLDDDISLEVVEGIGKLKEELQPETVHVVLKDAGLKDDVVKTNAIQLLKRYDINDVKTL